MGRNCLQMFLMCLECLCCQWCSHLSSAHLENQWEKHWKTICIPFIWGKKKRWAREPNSKTAHSHTHSMLFFKILAVGQLCSAFTQRSFTQRSFTRRIFYTEKFVHREDFTHWVFYTQRFLHREAFYTEQFFHRGAFTQRNFYTE